MLAALVRSPTRRSVVPWTSYGRLNASNLAGGLSGRPELAAVAVDESSLEEARQWLTSFTVDSIPRNGCNITYSRSSGPGGQNVNKYGVVYSKRMR